MARTPRLKVYAAAAGFTEAVVAAPNQKAALEAWGARADYFAQGVARVVDDPETVEAALAQPGVVLKRPVGSAADLVAAARPPAKTAAKPRAAPVAKAGAKAPKPTRRRPDRGPLDAAQAALKTAQQARRDLLRDQAAAREALDDRQAAERETAEAELRSRKAAAERARRDYDRARG